MFALILAISVTVDPAGDAEMSAKSKADADGLVAAAKKHFVQRQYAKAIEEFKAAFALDGKTADLYNIGKCHERLKETGTALRYYREYLRIEPTAEKDGLLKGDIANAIRRLKEEGKQQLVIVTEPAGADISVDGAKQPQPQRPAQKASPAYVELKAGEHVFVVSAEGYQPEERPLKVPLPAGSTEQTFTLVAVPSDAPKAPANATLTPVEPAKPKPDIIVKESPKKPLRIGVATWVSGGVAVAAGATAIGLGAAYGASNKALHTSDAGRLTAQTTALEKRTGELAMGANIAMGVAGAGLVAAVVLFFVEK
jgi:tetratricopeptide (TPR) repeat protein